MNPVESAQIDRVYKALSDHRMEFAETLGKLHEAMGDQIAASREQTAAVRALTTRLEDRRNGASKSHADLASLSEDENTGVRILAATALKKKAAAEYIMSWVRVSGAILKWVLLVAAAALGFWHGFVWFLSVAGR